MHVDKFLFGLFFLLICLHQRISSSQEIKGVEENLFFFSNK